MSVMFFVEVFFYDELLNRYYHKEKFDSNYAQVVFQYIKIILFFYCLPQCLTSGYTYKGTRVIFAFSGEKTTNRRHTHNRHNIIIMEFTFWDQKPWPAALILIVFDSSGTGIVTTPIQRTIAWFVYCTHRTLRLFVILV